MINILYRAVLVALVLTWLVAAPRVFLDVLAEADLSTRLLVGAWLVFACAHAVEALCPGVWR